jgi:hypothetical protein
MLFTNGSISGRNDGSAVGVVLNVVWFCVLVVPGSRVVTGVWRVCCVGRISGSVTFFSSEIVCWDVAGGDGAGVVHPAASMTMQSTLTTIKKLVCITPAWEEESDKGSPDFLREKYVHQLFPRKGGDFPVHGSRNCRFLS